MTAAGGSVPAVVVEGIGKRYGGRPVLDGVTFEVGRGEIFALLGPNGAGKTTTVEIIEGYRRPDAGSVAVLGTEPARGGPEHRARVGLMLQGSGGVDPRMTAREAVDLQARFHADPRSVDDTLDAVGLPPSAWRTRYRRLSGGERQRVGLAMALVGRPDVAILDEPTAGMDVEARAATRSLLEALRDDGVAILVTSHDLVDVERVADRIAILDRGRVVAMGRPADLGGDHATLRFRLLDSLDDADRTLLGERLGARVADDGERGRYRVDGVEPTPAVVAAVATWCADRGAVIAELRTGGATLEERYLEILGASTDGEPV